MTIRILIKRLLTFALCLILLTGLLGCGKNYTCEECGASFSGKIYYGMGGDEIFCEDCARSYWMPLDYRKFKYDKAPTQTYSVANQAGGHVVDSEDTGEESIWEDSEDADESVANTPDPELVRAEELHKLTEAIQGKLAEYDAAQNATGAYQYLSEQLELMQVTYGETDAALEEKRQGYLDTCADSLLKTAKNTYEQNGYEAALNILREGIGQLGTTTEQIEAAKEYYNSFAPVYLADLEYFMREGPGLKHCTEMTKDNLGNEHEKVLGCADGIGYNGPKSLSQTYVLDTRYSRLTGSCFLRFQDRDVEKLSAEFHFYGDEQLLFSSGDIHAGSMPVDFDIDLTGVNQLRIELSAVEKGTMIGTMGATGYYQIGDALLLP